MPVKWSAEADQMLLLKILETSEVNANVKQISDSWPSNLEKPTPRAITERIVKIRSQAKCSGSAAHFSITKGVSGGGGTPRKRPANGVKKTPIKGKGGGKRKRGGMSEDDLTDDEEGNAKNLKTEGNGTDASDEENDTPKKKVKTANKKTNGKTIIKTEEAEVEGNGAGMDDPFGGDGTGEGYEGAIFA